MIDIRRDVPGLWCDDITFCSEKCDWKQCPRNQKNIRDRTVPHSFSIDIPGDCPKLLEGRRSEMTDREKVINGIAHCKALYGCYNCQSIDGEDCPYVDEPDCRFSIMQDALALLKEQEPRVMTLEEVKVCNEPVYLEEIPFSIFGSFFNWGLVCTANENNVTVSVMLRNATMRHCACAMYGKRWRCWTAKPTDKQRQAVKWE